MAAGRRASRFERRPALTLGLVTIGGLALLALALEVGLRATLDYHIDYYAGARRQGRVEYPWGFVTINAHGQPDREFDLADPRPRVGWYGDSVVYGVGAGQGHRLPDLVAEARPHFQHMALAAVGARLKDPERVVRLAQDLGLDTLVYVMNLNDVTPDPPPRTATPGASAGAGEPEPGRQAPPREPWLRRVRKLVLERFDGLRTRSYLYNFVRLRVKNLLVRAGYESSGFRAAELEPSRHRGILDATARRVNETARRLGERDVRFCVLLLPYEMQISAPAAHRYRELGVRWEDGFLERQTQRELLARFDPAIEALDAFFAFVDPDHVAASRRANGLGDYFVYDRGDKIDWNHPTRAGHRRIAELVLARGFCGMGAVEAPGA